MLIHVVKHMATKDDLAAVETRLDDRIDKLDAKLDRLESDRANMRSYFARFLSGAGA